MPCLSPPEGARHFWLLRRRLSRSDTNAFLPICRSSSPLGEFRNTLGSSLLQTVLHFGKVAPTFCVFAGGAGVQSEVELLGELNPPAGGQMKSSTPFFKKTEQLRMSPCTREAWTPCSVAFTAAKLSIVFEMSKPVARCSWLWDAGKLCGD